MSAADTSPAPTAEFLAEDKGPSVIAALWTFATLATVFVALRCYVRISVKKVFGVDDGCVVLALVLLLCMISVDTLAVTLGLGRHLVYLLANAPAQALVDLTFYLWMGNAFAVMANAFAKMSFAFTLMRVLPQQYIQICLWIIIVSLFLIHAVLDVMIYVQCKDTRTLWNPVGFPGECWPTRVLTNYALFVGSWSALCDFGLAALPWFIIPQLKMPLRDKLGIAFAMSLGVVAGVAAITKTVQLPNLSSSDPTYGQPDLTIWGGIEVATTIIASCISTLRPLGRKLFPGSSAERYGSKESGGGFKLGRLGGSGNGNLSDSAPGDRFNPKSRGTNQTLVTIGSKPSRNPKSPAAGTTTMDDDSDKSILDRPDAGEIGAAISGTSLCESEGGAENGGRHSPRQGGIRATHEVRVQYDRSDV
ncbi:hypothetical protein RB595_003918 [Gaeumannomyces hyphopodioides]